MCLTSAEELRELRRREKEQGIQSNWEIDSFMAADTLEGKREAIVTEYMLRILGLDVSMPGKKCIALQLRCLGCLGVMSHCSVMGKIHMSSCVLYHLAHSDLLQMTSCYTFEQINLPKSF